MPGSADRHASIPQYVGERITARLSTQDLGTSSLDVSATNKKFSGTRILTRREAKRMFMIEHGNRTRSSCLGSTRRRLGLHLNERQAKIISLLCMGRRQSEVAILMGLSMSGVEYHISDAKKRMGAKTLIQLIALAINAREVMPFKEDHRCR